MTTTAAIYAAPVLAGAYRGRDIGKRALLRHAVIITSWMRCGLFLRFAGEAFCDASLSEDSGSLVDSGTWTKASDVSCPRCIKVIARLRKRGVIA